VCAKICVIAGDLLLASGFGVLAAEALDTASGIHQLLLASKERMTVGADFQVDVALMRGASDKRVPAGAVYAHFVIGGMNGGFHDFF
jgi:hypothetical protein